MRHPARKTLKSWVDLLNGNVFYNGNPVAGYRTDVDSAETEHYYILRVESSSGANNNREFVNNLVIIVDIVTRFKSKVDDTVVFDISTEIDRLVFPNPSHHGLPAQSGFQIVSIVKQNETVLTEDDGSIPKINRLVARYVHRILQTDES